MVEMTVPTGSTLVVDGPASVVVREGAAECFGALLKKGTKAVVRKDKRMPFFAVEPFSSSINLGHGSSYDVLSKDTIPASWKACVDKISSTKPKSVIVIGSTDSGKSGLSLYIANRCIRSNLLPVCFIDTDLGQSDLGPPGTIGLAILDREITDIQSIHSPHLEFIGTTSPYFVQTRILSLLKKLVFIAESQNSKIIIVNTDGWVNGSEAMSFKKSLVDIMPSPLIIGIQKNEIISNIENTLKEEICWVESPSEIKIRTQETRKKLRGLIFSKYLAGGKIRAFDNKRVELIGNWEDAMNNIVGLFGKDREFLGIGVVLETEPIKGLIKVYTSVQGNVRKIVIGTTKLDVCGRELP